MATILAIQSRFDKDIPQDFGNAEYRQERELLISINDIIVTSGLEHSVTQSVGDSKIGDRTHRKRTTTSCLTGLLIQ